MYENREIIQKVFRDKTMRKKLVIPSMLDAHFDLLQYAFYSKNVEMIVIRQTKDIVKTGLSYAHNDLCYPAILIIGQLVCAVRRGEIQPEECVFLIPQAGDACRGSNYLHLIRKALVRAGIDMKVISLNFIEEQEISQFHLSPMMLWKALEAVLYGDLLMILSNQIIPYEKNAGETQQLCYQWTVRLQQDLMKNQHLGILAMKSIWHNIIDDFAAIPRVDRSCTRVGIVGELYIKYCALGNHHLIQRLLEMGAEPMVNGFSWYALYYIRTHLTELSMVNPIKAAVYRMAGNFIEWMQKQMVETLHCAGFTCFDAFSEFEKIAREKYHSNCSIGDGWLIGAEICNYAAIGCQRIACVQPFGCMANQVCGKGIYASLQRKLENVRLAVLDYDASGSEIQWLNRLALLLDS